MRKLTALALLLAASLCGLSLLLGSELAAGPGARLADQLSMYLLYRSDSFSMYLDHFEEGDLRGGSEDGRSLYSNGADRSRERVFWKPSADLAGLPRLESASPLLDALFLLALEEVKRDTTPSGAFRAGAAFDDHVWVRDSCYSLLLATGLLFPQESRRCLEETASPRGTISLEQLEADPDGERYDMTDFIIWIVAAWEYYEITGDAKLLSDYYPAMARTLRLMERIRFDAADGLFLGGNSFLDGVNAYPVGLTREGRIKALSNNGLYYQAYLSLARIARLLGRPDDAADFNRRARFLRDAINRHLWWEEQGCYRQLKAGPGHLEPRSEGLGEALALLFRLAPAARATAVLERTPQSPWGLPTIYPGFADGRPVYHHGSTWPFVQALWGWAAAEQGDADRLLASLAAVARVGAKELTFKELVRLDNGDGVGSDRQLWSAAGFLGLVTRGLFGLRFAPEGMSFSPLVPEALSGPLRLSGLRYREAVLTLRLSGPGAGLRRVLLDGRPLASNRLPQNLRGNHLVELELNPQPVFARLDTPLVLVVGATVPVTAAALLPPGAGQPELVTWLEGNSGEVAIRPRATASGPREENGSLHWRGEFALLPAEAAAREATLKLRLQSADAAGLPVAFSPEAELVVGPPLDLALQPEAMVVTPPLLAPGAELRLLARNNTLEELKGELEVEAPAGWVVTPEKIALSVAAQSQATWDLQARPRTGEALSPGVYPISVRVKTPAGESSLEASIIVQEEAEAPAAAPGKQD
jgi:hypothetical protein